VALGLVLGTIVLILYIAQNKWNAATDVVAVLGVTVPALATIGAAVFGVAAYDRGKEAGAAQGRSRGWQEGRRSVARQVAEALALPAGPPDVVAAGPNAADDTSALVTVRAIVNGVLGEPE
jgi:hypothetical protein